MNIEEVRSLLRIHDQAYRFLVFLAGAMKDDPELFSEAVVDQLRTKRGCREWLDEHWDFVPPDSRPGEAQREPFSNVFWSFFQVSFRMETLTWNDRVVESSLKTGSLKEKSVQSLRKTKLHALERLCRIHGIRCSQDVLATVLLRKDLFEAVTLWTFIWELRQRAKGKSKGPVLHRLWRSLSRERRRELNAEQVMSTAEKLIAALDLSQFATCRECGEYP